MKNILLSIVLMILSFNLLIAQADTNIQQNIVKELTDKTQLKKSQRLTETQIEQIYLYQDWKNRGSVFTKEKRYKLDNINYNLLNDVFDARMSKDSVYTFDNSMIDSVAINNHVYLKVFQNSKNRFYEILSPGSKVVFLKKHELRTKKGKYDNLTGKTSADRYIKVRKYYLKEGNNLIEFKLSKKDIEKVVKERSAEVLKFAKKSKLSFKKEEDVAAIFKYYNSLL